jgi:MoaA/NifB/PqqE/SkfB family radical SAM enzyme
MADGRANSLSVDEWKEGIIQLDALGCKFIAFYGAEPLYNSPENLAEVVGFAEFLGIHTTVITSGVVPHSDKLIKMLYDKGAKSLSVSYDILACDKNAIAKTNKALPLLRLFKSFGPVRDVAAIATIGEHKFLMMPKAIEQLTKEGIWFFFDILHPDRHQPGSKCSGSGEPYLIKSWDKFAKTLDHLLEMKECGYLCHTSFEFMRFIKSKVEAKHPQMFTCWNCADEELFPGLVTVDSDGLVYPCDDFQPRIYKEVSPIIITNIYYKFEKFTELWRPIIKQLCPGCLWNTHFDTFRILEGGVPFSDYVHTGGNNG